MLGKLIKHEWRSTYRVGCIMLLVVAVFTAIGCIACSTPAMTALFENHDIEGAQVIGIFSFMGSIILYVCMLVGVSYGIMIYLGVHFYRSMYSDEGYLANTLPVTRHQLLGSKVLISGIWSLIVEIVVLVSIAALTASLFACILRAAGESYSLWEVFSKGFSELVRIYRSELNFNLLQYLSVALISLLLNCFTSVGILFGALTIGQLSKKHKVMMGIFTYFGISIVMSIIRWVVTATYTANYVAGPMSANLSANVSIDGTMVIDLLINTAVAVGLYFLSHYILSQKLNLD